MSLSLADSKDVFLSKHQRNPQADIDAVTLTLISQTTNDHVGPRVLHLKAGVPFTIGRSSNDPLKSLTASKDNAFFDCKVMSRKHAQLIAPEGLPGPMELVDQSKHGVYANGVRLKKDYPQKLSTGVVLRLGEAVDGQPPLSIRVDFTENRPADKATQDFNHGISSLSPLHSDDVYSSFSVPDSYDSMSEHSYNSKHGPNSPVMVASRTSEDDDECNQNNKGNEDYAVRIVRQGGEDFDDHVDSVCEGEETWHKRSLAHGPADATADVDLAPCSENVASFVSRPLEPVPVVVNMAESTKGQTRDEVTAATSRSAPTFTMPSQPLDGGTTGRVTAYKQPKVGHVEDSQYASHMPPAVETDDCEEVTQNISCPRSASRKQTSSLVNKLSSHDPEGDPIKQRNAQFKRSFSAASMVIKSFFELARIELARQRPSSPSEKKRRAEAAPPSEAAGKRRRSTADHTFPLSTDPRAEASVNAATMARPKSGDEKVPSYTKRILAASAYATAGSIATIAFLASPVADRLAGF